MRYQGHLPDGSSIQRHSAGGLYPFVIQARQSGDKIEYGVIEPDGSSIWTGGYDSAVDRATELKRALDRKAAEARALAHNQRQWSAYSAQRR